MNDDEDGLTDGLQRLETLLQRIPRVQATANNTLHFGSFSIGISIACALVVIVSTVWVAYELKRQNDDIRDLRAWNAVYGQRLQAAESQLSHLEKHQ